MNPASVDIKTLLEGESGLGLAFKTNLFIGKAPAKPDNYVTLFDTPGRPPVMSLEGKIGTVLNFPSVQVRVRNVSYTAGWALVNMIKEFLHGVIGTTIDGTLYSSIKCANEPFFLGWEGNNSLAIFTVTFDIQRA